MAEAPVPDRPAPEPRAPAPTGEDAGGEPEGGPTRTLVTGGDGFVGEHLIARLLDEGDDVAASALSLPPDRDTLSVDRMAEVEWKVADVLDRPSLYRLVAAVRPDRIFHLAGFSSGARAREEPEVAMQVNAGGTVNLLEAVLQAREDFPDLDPCIVVLGSGDAYGAAAPGPEGLHEDAPLEPVTPYGLSKAAQEMAAHTYRRGFGLRVVVARPFNLLGPGQKGHFVVPSFCGQLRDISAGRSEPVLRVGNLDVERDFTDVRDGADALLAISGVAEEAPVYNVCTGRACSIRRLLEWIVDEAGIEVEVEVDPDRVRDEEVPRVVGDCRRIREHTDWRPSRPVEESVRETYRWIAGRRA